MGRLIPVRQVVNLTRQGKFVQSSMAFIKLVGSVNRRSEVIRVAENAGASIVDTTDNAIIFSITSTTAKIDELIKKMRAFGTVELARTGIVAIACGESMLTVPQSPPGDRQTA